MLHFMFDEPELEPSPALAETYKLMDSFAAHMSGEIVKGHDDSGNKLRKYEVWTMGLRASLIELEQSQYAAMRFMEKITSTAVEQMSREEKLDYDRYVYFDKNAFIRVFSLLDKLGTFLNTLLMLRTEKVKPHFSYFTVLRHMLENDLHPDFANNLNIVKEKYRDAMKRLRNRRNMEIHYMNSEMQDDLIQSQRMYGEVKQLEDIKLQAEDLTKCLFLTVESLRSSYRYACKLMRIKTV